MFVIKIMINYCLQVQERISGLGDLVAAEAVYHRLCYKHFHAGLDKSGKKSKCQRGRPSQSTKDVMVKVVTKIKAYIFDH